MPKEFSYKHKDDPTDVFDSVEYGLESCPQCGGDVVRVWGLAGFTIN